MVQQVLQRFDFTYSSPQATPLSTRHSLSALPSDESVEPSGPYPELVGCLVYLMTCTRPDLAYPLSILARYVAPGRHRLEHMAAAKRVLRYLCSTSGLGLVLGARSSVVLTGHADASWELRWLTYTPRSPPVLYVDNKAMLALCREHRLEHRTKHIALRYFLARELQQRGQLSEAEIYAGAMAAQELHWLTYLLTDLGERPYSPLVLRGRKGGDARGERRGRKEGKEGNQGGKGGEEKEGTQGGKGGDARGKRRERKGEKEGKHGGKGGEAGEERRGSRGGEGGESGESAPHPLPRRPLPRLIPFLVVPYRASSPSAPHPLPHLSPPSPPLPSLSASPLPLRHSPPYPPLPSPSASPLPLRLSPPSVPLPSLSASPLPLRISPPSPPLPSLSASSLPIHLSPPSLPLPSLSAFCSPRVDLPPPFKLLAAHPLRLSATSQ
ncbi:unnamed protein product [Closterium sp. NIES-54]